ncbi:MAG: alpha-L-fucosidase [Bacteroidota bacterium]
MKKYFLFILLGFLVIPAHSYSQDNYPFVPEKDPLTLKNLDQWNDWKFGLLMHWGAYSVWGIVESWSLCPEDEGWCARRKGGFQDYYSYKKDYEALPKSFNPTRFNPERWAKAAKDAGMKYMIFTTKHHDGFCMYDTRQTDYKITNPDYPFAKNPKADVTKAIFNAFRAEGLSVGAYFSKPDWHCENYWWPYFPPKSRNVNYEVAKYPERWQKYRDFSYNQIDELTRNYGKVDILWLDGGWVRPDSTIDEKVEWERGLPKGQDVDMGRIAKMARANQPGIIIVDRWVPGPYENYHTPEQSIPSKPLPYPWESCMTLGDSWSYIPQEHFKSTEKVLENLVNIVSRGGNYLLNVAPGPDGEWHEEAYSKLAEIGAWMNVNSEGIYNTRPLSPYQETNNLRFTSSKSGKIIYCFVLDNATEIKIPKIKKDKVQKITALGLQGKLSYKTVGDEFLVALPKDWKTRLRVVKLEF